MTPITGKAQDIATLDVASIGPGTAVSIRGAVSEFVSKAGGKKNSITVVPEGYSGDAVFTVQLGSIYSGTDVRDAQTVKGFADFTNQTEWSQYAKALNSQLDELVVAPLAIDESIQGKTVQIVPHITDEIKRRMLLLGQTGDYDVILTEIGGTVGDMESQPFVEAVRQLQWELPEEDCMSIHLTLIPYLSAAKELKTKPTQHSVQALQKSGVQPDVIVCRTEHPLSQDLRRKIALFCNVRPGHVIQSIDAWSIYQVPLNMHEEHLDELAVRKLQIENFNQPELTRWKTFLNRIANPSHEVQIVLVGKYVELQDAYKSIQEAFVHAGAANDCKVNVRTVQSENVTSKNVAELLTGADGILVAPGFGERGLEGKVHAVRYARENGIPFLGICLGMQMCVVEFARDVLGWKDAASTELDVHTKHPVIDMMEDQKKTTIKGGTMRLGAYACHLEPGSLAASLYESTEISERHRHRYEFNSKYLDDFTKAGLKATGRNPDTGLVEVVELPGHPFFIGVQFHPEYKSTPEDPHPLFKGLVKAALAYRKKSKA